MRKISLFLLFGILCIVLAFSVVNELFWQRGMTISVHTETGEIPLYNESYALVIGNGSYTNGWDPLDGVLKDVRDVAIALEKHGFTVTVKTDLKKADFEAVFEAFIREGEGKTNRLLFYYGGHGHTEINKQTGEEFGYIVMVDSPMPTATGKIDGSKNVSIRSLTEGAKRIEALHVLYLFDSSFSDTFLNVRNSPQPCTVQDSVKYPVRQFIIAGSANEPAPNASVLKAAFLDLLEGRVAEPIPDGYITGEELALYLNHHVPEYNHAQTPQYGKIADPKFNRGDFVFVFQAGKIKADKEIDWLKQIVGKDETKMVPILAGEFKMGSDDRDAHPDESPVHIVYLDAFYMDIHEVTNVQYKKFVDANPEWGKMYRYSKYRDNHYLKHWHGNSYPRGKGNHPVVNVSWYAAMAYAEWAGKRLPTEAEWEKAARGGLAGQKFLRGISQSNRGIGTPMGIYEPNPYGLYGMADWVWEWCLDEYDEYDPYFYKNSPRENPIARGGNQSIDGLISFKGKRVYRGGSWHPGYVRLADRGWASPTDTYPQISFRCVMPVIP